MIKINNEPCLPYKIIGEVLDEYIEKDEAVTLYDGMKEYVIFEHQKIQYKMEIEYKITCVKIAITELDIAAKDVSMKGVRFPRIKKEVK